MSSLKVVLPNLKTGRPHDTQRTVIAEGREFEKQMFHSKIDKDE